MKRKDRVRNENEERFYPIFKGYKVKPKKKKAGLEQHFVVPWEMTHEKCTKLVY